MALYLLQHYGRKIFYGLGSERRGNDASLQTVRFALHHEYAYGRHVNARKSITARDKRTSTQETGE